MKAVLIAERLGLRPVHLEACKKLIVAINTPVHLEAHKKLVADCSISTDIEQLSYIGQGKILIK